MTRTEKIEQAVSAAGQLIGALTALGPVNGEQAAMLMLAASRAAVPNLEEWEVRDAAIKIVEELANEDRRRNGK